jgi:DNA-binding ferritin-like protein
MKRLIQAKAFFQNVDQEELRHLLEGLLDDLSSLQVFYQQTKLYHWTSAGVSYFEVHKFFDMVAEETLELIDSLAERIAYMGATPTAELNQVDYRSYVTFSDMAPTFNQDVAMDALENNSDLIINNLRTNAQFASELQDSGTVQMLEEMIYKLESLQHHIDSYKPGTSTQVPPMNPIMNTFRKDDSVPATPVAQKEPTPTVPTPAPAVPSEPKGPIAPPVPKEDDSLNDNDDDLVDDNDDVVVNNDNKSNNLFIKR